MTLLLIATLIAFTIWAAWLAVILVEHRRRMRR